MLKEMNNLQFGEFTLDRRSRELKRGDVTLSVSGKAFDLLAYMVENPGRPLSKSELLGAVWPETSVEESNLSQNVFLLRKVLGSAGDGPIKTLPGRGYQFATQVKELVEAGSPAEHTTPSGSSISAITVQTTSTRVVMEDELEERRPARLLTAALVLVGIIAATVGSILFLHHRDLKHVADNGTPTASLAQSRPAVAVLGFHNFTDKPEHAWLSTAIAEMLASEMSVGDRLRVIPSDDVARAQSDLGIKATPVDYAVKRASLQKATGADMLIEGSYVLVGNSLSPALRLMVEVVDAHSGKQLASVTETGKLDALFVLVDEASAELRRELADLGSSQEEQQAFSAMSHNLEALRLYSEGIERQRAFDAHSARSLFERSVATDPKFALAHLGLADVWSDLGFQERATGESAEAYKLSATLPRAQRLAIEADYKARLHDSDHATEDAIALYKALATFYPDDPVWTLKLAQLQFEDGRHKDTVATLERLNPQSLTPSQLVDRDGFEAAAWSHMDDPQDNLKARARLNEAVATADAQGGLFIHGRAYRHKCFALSHIGPVPAAQAACEQAKATFQAIGNLEAVAAATNNLGVLAQQTGDWKQAEIDYEEARSLDHQLGNLEGEILGLQNLSELDVAHGELARAIAEATELSLVKGTIDDNHTAYEGHYYVAVALVLSGRLAEAKTAALQAQRSADNEHPWDFKVFQQARSRDVQGWIALRSGDTVQAQTLFTQAINMVKPTHDPEGEAIFAVDLATAAAEEGHPDKSSLDSIRHAASVLSQFQDSSDEAVEAQVQLAELSIEAGLAPEAIQAIEKARKLDSQGDSLSTHLDFLIGEAKVQQATGHEPDARKSLQEAITAAQEKGYRYETLSAQIALAEMDARLTSPRNIAQLKTLKQEAERAGFKGLAGRANSL